MRSRTCVTGIAADVCTSASRLSCGGDRCRMTTYANARVRRYVLKKLLTRGNAAGRCAKTRNQKVVARHGRCSRGSHTIGLRDVASGGQGEGWMRKLRILLANDHATVRDGLKLIVDAQPDMTVVGQASDGRGAVEKALQTSPDVVVMDVSMPGVNGLKATEILRQQCPDVKVVALTRLSEAGYLRELLRVGALGYVLKQSSSASLLTAIRAVAAGGTYLDPAVAHEMVGARGTSMSRSTGNPAGALTARETEVAR